MIPSNHLILCHALLLLLSIFPSIRVFSNESALHIIRWPKYWSFSFSISPSNEHSGLISFRMDWLDLLAVQGTLKSLPQHHSSKASIPRCSAFFTVQLSHPYMTTGKTIALTRRTFVDKVMSLLLNMLSRLVITFLPRSKQASFNFMAAVTICSDFGAPQNKVCHFTGWAGANCKMRYLPPWRHQDGSSKHRTPVSPEQCSHLAALGPFPAGCGDLDPLDGACAIWSATGLPHSPSGLAKPVGIRASSGSRFTSPWGHGCFQSCSLVPWGQGERPAWAAAGTSGCALNPGAPQGTPAPGVRCGPGAVLWGRPPAGKRQGRACAQGHTAAKRQSRAPNGLS